MERLTKKLTDNYYTYNCGTNEFIQGGCGDYCNKLGKLEDIEDELGISLEVLFKALKDGVYKKINNQIWKCYDLDIHYNISEQKYMLNAYSIENIETFEASYETTIYIEDYGKTWFLTKEELD